MTKPAKKKKPVAKKPAAAARKPAARKPAAKKPENPEKQKPAFPALFFFFEVLAVRQKEKPEGETIAIKIDRALDTFTDYLHDEHDKLKREAKMVLGADRVEELLPIAVTQGVVGLDVDSATALLRTIIDSER